MGNSDGVTRSASRLGNKLLDGKGYQMAQRAEEVGKSEHRPEMGRIGVALCGNITLRESGLTSNRSFFTRKLHQPTKAAKQMTADTPAGVASHDTVDWQAIDWHKVNQNVRRLQARIVKAIRRVLHRAFERLEP